MKKWTKTEQKSFKIKVQIEFKMGKLPINSKELVIRPYKMEAEDFDLLLNLFETYGQPK